MLKKRLTKNLWKFNILKLGKFGKLVERTKRAKVGIQGNKKEIKRQSNRRRKLETKHQKEKLSKRKDKILNPKQEHQPAWRLTAKTVGYMKLLKDKVANFGKQSARITKQIKTGSKYLTSVTKYFYKLLHK